MKFDEELKAGYGNVNFVWDRFIDETEKEIKDAAIRGLSEDGKRAFIMCLASRSDDVKAKEKIFERFWEALKKEGRYIDETLGKMIYEAIGDNAFPTEVVIDIIRNEWLHKENKSVMNRDIDKMNNGNFKMTKHLERILDNECGWKGRKGFAGVVVREVLEFPIKKYRYVEDIGYITNLFQINEDKKYIDEEELKSEVYECIKERWGYIIEPKNYEFSSGSYYNVSGEIENDLDWVLCKLYDKFKVEIEEKIMQHGVYFLNKRISRLVAANTEKEDILNYMIENLFKDERIRVAVSENKNLTEKHMHDIITKSTCGQTLKNILSNKRIPEKEVIRMFKKAKNYKNHDLIEEIKRVAPESCKALYSL